MNVKEVARCWAAFASLGAGLVHLAVVHEHFVEWWVFGVFFAVTGAAQLLWALAALARDRAPWLRTVAAGNLALVALWAVTRTVGLPVGPERWTPEAAGRADVLCVLLEVGVATSLLMVAQATGAPAPTAEGPVATRSVPRFLALVFAGAVAVAAITTPALAATESGGHAHQHVGLGPTR